jgi:hypothetical protein
LSAKKRVGNFESIAKVKDLESEYFLADSEEVKRVVDLLKKNGD